MRKLIIIFIFFSTPIFAGKVERLGFYNIQELLEDDNLTYKIIKSCVSLNSAITEITREDHPELSKSFFATCLLYTSPSPRDGLLSRMPSSA